MRNLILSLLLVAVTFTGFKVYADIQSLGTAIPAASDTVQIYDASAGQYIGVNWSFLSRNLLQGVNWVGLSTTTGSINWNYIGATP